MNRRVFDNRRIHRMPGVTLLEVILVLTIVVFAAWLVGWCMVLQFDTNRRIGQATDRDATARSILHQMRTDLLNATSVAVDGPHALPQDWSAEQKSAARPAVTGSGRNLRWRGPGDRVTIHGPGGDTVYQVDVDGPLDRVGEGRADPPEPAMQTVTRTAPGGATHVWHVRGQIMRFAPVEGGGDRLLNVRLTHGDAFMTGNERTRRLEATLRVGGRS